MLLSPGRRYIPTRAAGGPDPSGGACWIWNQVDSCRLLLSREACRDDVAACWDHGCTDNSGHPSRRPSGVDSNVDSEGCVRDEQQSMHWADRRRDIWTIEDPIHDDGADEHQQCARFDRGNDSEDLHHAGFATISHNVATHNKEWIPVNMWIWPTSRSETDSLASTPSIA